MMKPYFIRGINHHKQNRQIVRMRSANLSIVHGIGTYHASLRAKHRLDKILPFAPNHLGDADDKIFLRGLSPPPRPHTWSQSIDVQWVAVHHPVPRDVFLAVKT